LFGDFGVRCRSDSLSVDAEKIADLAYTEALLMKLKDFVPVENCLWSAERLVLLASARHTS